MDYVDRMAGRSARFNPDTLLKFTPLSRPVQQHLTRVYFTLACALVLAALGTWTNLVTGFPPGIVSILGFVGCATWLGATQPSSDNLNKRYLLLAGAAFSQGATLGPLVSAVLAVNPGLLLTAFLGTAAVFACFSVAAMLSQRRSFLYLGASLSSAISIFAVMRLGTWAFGGRNMLFQAELYGGLLVFLGYVLFDTQIMIEKAYAGNKDHIKDALSLFVDAVAIFVRVLVILLQNDSKKEERQRRKRR